MITEILTKSNDSILPPLSVHMRPKVKVAKSESEPESIAEPALSDQDMAAAIMHARESFRIAMKRFTSRNGLDTIYMKDEGVFIAAAAQVVEEEPAVIAPPPPQFQIGNLVVEGDGSDTESDGNWEEIVPSSPIREADVGSDAISTGTGSQKRKLSRSTSDTHPRDSTYPDKRAKIVHPELLDVLNTLEKQTRTLKEAYRSTKLARRRDQVERQEILRSLRQEQNERQYILESLRRQEEEVRQQRAAWRREQEEIRREYTELLDSN